MLLRDIPLYHRFFPRIRRAAMNRMPKSLLYLISLALLALAANAAADPQFADVAAQAGIDFKHDNGSRGERYIAETMASGMSFMDYDEDGWYDLYFVNIAGPGGLFRNLGNGHFEETTDGAGVSDSGYGMGCVAADYDNDGDTDLYISTYGPNLLYRNEGDGRFSEVGTSAGVAHPGLSTGTAFADYDNDGDLDLFVANYLAYSPELHKTCSRQGMEVYCGPDAFASEPDVLYRNEGDGSFIEVSKSVGIVDLEGKELGAFFSDFDSDGDMDLYVAGDRTANLLYQNNGGVFEEVSLMAGTSFNDAGGLEAGMGVAVGDYDNDGRKDFFVTNFLWETNTLYHNDGDGFFTDMTSMMGLATPSAPFLSWGTVFFDFDNDGDRDIFVASGHLDDNVHMFENSTFEQPNQLYRNDGEQGFAEISAESGPGFDPVRSSRGAVAGDYDNDGDVDIAINNNNEQAALLRNDGGNSRHWIGVRTVGTVSNRDGVGAQISITTANGRQVREVRSGESYISRHDPRVFFGLGGETTIDLVEIRWPSGKVQSLEGVAADQVLTVREEGE
jgi:enediyne biosynthesis protein E4